MTEQQPETRSPGPVVVGFEGSASGEDAISLALWLSRILGVPTAVAVVHPSPTGISMARIDAGWLAERRRAAEQVLDEARKVVAASGADDEQVSFRVVASSSAAHGLHDLAEDLDAALIVVGSRGGAPPERLFAGSTADRLLSGSQWPVAVAPVGMRTRRPGELTRIGVAYIETPEGAAALKLAARLAGRVSATLRLYTVLAEEAEIMPLFIGADSEQAFTATARDSYRLDLDAAIAGLPTGLHAGGEVLTGPVVDVLAELDEDDVDVLFCGSRGYGPVRRILLGGVSSRLVRKARSPVIVVPRGG